MKPKWKRGEVPYDTHAEDYNPNGPKGRPGIISGNVGIVYEKQCAGTVADIIHIPSGLRITWTRRLGDAKALVDAIRAEFGHDLSLFDQLAAQPKQTRDWKRCGQIRRRIRELECQIESSRDPKTDNPTS